MVRMVAVVLVAVAMALIASSSGQAVCPAQVPLYCAPYLLEGRPVPLRFCCIEVQNNFQLLSPSSSLQPWCDAVKGVKLYTGEGLNGTALDLALSLPQTCGLSGQYRQGQTCDGKLMPGGS